MDNSADIIIEATAIKSVSAGEEPISIEDSNQYSRNSFWEGTTVDEDKVLFEFHPELFRFAAFVSFWIIFILASIITSRYVDPKRIENSRLYALYNGSVACSVLDYEPSKTMAAALFFFFDLNMCLYFICSIFKWAGVKDVSSREYYFWVIVNLIKVVVIAEFRLVFVYHPDESYDNLVRHTLPYLALQIALLVHSLENFYYLHLMHFLPQPTSNMNVNKCMAWFYLAVNIVLTLQVFLKVATRLAGSDLYGAILADPGWRMLGRLFDFLWFLWATVLVAWVAYLEMKVTPTLKIWVPRVRFDD